jgi:hypothetical protein
MERICLRDEEEQMGRLLAAACLLVSVLALSAAEGPQTIASLQPLVMHPTVAEYAFISSSTTPPTEAQCVSVGRRCFTPQSTRAAYNIGPLYSQGFDGRGQTIAIVDSYGSDTIAHDLHVFNQAFGLQSMCGEEGVNCTAGLPTFSQLFLQGSPATKAQPPTSNGTHLEDKSAWALEVSLDVETAHAIAPMANILLVTTPTAETLGVQGFPDMMNAEQYVVDHHLATVISQSFASAEDAFGSAQSLQNLRHAFIAAQQNGVTVLGSSGDSGTANVQKQPVNNPRTIPSSPVLAAPTSAPTQITSQPARWMAPIRPRSVRRTRLKRRWGGRSAAAASAASLASPHIRMHCRPAAHRSATCAACRTSASRRAQARARSSISRSRRTGKVA